MKKFGKAVGSRRQYRKSYIDIEREQKRHMTELSVLSNSYENNNEDCRKWGESGFVREETETIVTE